MAKYVNFQFLEPKSVEEAINLYQQSDGWVKFMAGGQSLLIMMREGIIQPNVIISLLKIAGHHGIELDEAARMISIGGLSTHRAVERSPIVRRYCPLISDAYQGLGSVQVRNRGTLGGNLCHHAPGSDPPVALLALDATVTLQGSNGSRSVPIGEFGTDYYETVMADSEVLTSIQVPLLPDGAGSAYLKCSLRASDFPFVSVAVVAEKVGAACRDVRITLGGVGPRAVRAAGAEQVLRGETPTDSVIGEAARRAVEGLDPLSDHLGTAEYRRSLVPLIVKRAFSAAWERAS